MFCFFFVLSSKKNIFVFVTVLSNKDKRMVVMKFVHAFIVSNVIPFAIFFRAQIYANISGGFLLVNMNTLKFYR